MTLRNLKLYKSRLVSSISFVPGIQLKGPVNACKDPSHLPRRIDFPSFKDAAASIRRTTTDYNYQLVIQRVYEEGEEQLSANEDEVVDDGNTVFLRWR